MSSLLLFFFIFMVYSFLGWLIEEVFNYFVRGSFIKANYLLLPLKPMYGFAASILLLLYNHLTFWAFLPFLLIVPLLVEYAAAYLLDHFLGLRYWNYSHKSFQLHGYICLEYAICWVLLSALFVYWLHPYILMFYHFIELIWMFLCPLAFLILLTDFYLATYIKLPISKKH